MTDWKQIRMQYETLGVEVKTLAAENNVSELLLENAIAHEGWEVEEAATKLDPEKMVDALKVIRDTTLGPIYFKAEIAFLAKLTEVMNNLDETEPTAAKQLKQVADALVQFKPAALEPAENSVSDGITINIASGFGSECVNTPGLVADVVIPERLTN